MKRNAQTTAPAADQLQEHVLELASMHPGASGWIRALQPYLIVLATALVSGVVVPYIARLTQVNERELEIKTELAGDMGQAVAAFVNEIQSVEVTRIQTGGRPADTRELNAAYKQWMTESSVIAARVEAYFPDLADDWKAIAAGLEELYALTGTLDPQYRGPRVEAIRAAFAAARVDWKLLAENGQDWQTVEDWRPYEAAWFQLREAVLSARDKLVRRMLASSTTLS